MNCHWTLWAFAWLLIPGVLLSILLSPFKSPNDKYVLLGVYAIVTSFISVVTFMKWFWERKEQHGQRQPEYTLLQQDEFPI